jgi:hypothetical protein
MLSGFGIAAHHPDEFVSDLLTVAEEAVCLAVNRQRTNLRRPAVSADQLLTTFDRLNLKKTASILRVLIDAI